MMTLRLNRYAHWLRPATIALAVLGVLVSAYLTWTKVFGVNALCTAAGDCEAVNNSVYSEINGFPVAGLGLGAYVLITLLLGLENRWRVLQDYGPLAVFGLALTGTLYSAYLTYVELFVIRAVCPYCVISAVIITAILVLSSVRLARGAMPD
jgi:uncharacterized membrane protein